MSGIFDCKERVCFLAFRFPDDVCLAYVREKIYNGAMDEKIRINKYLSEAGVCSRREADRMIEEEKSLNKEEKIAKKKGCTEIQHRR